MRAKFDLNEARRRAAEIRENWTDLERRKRTGLPPDAPTQIRELMWAPRGAVWPRKVHV